jgi:hypothetical protein
MDILGGGEQYGRRRGSRGKSPPVTVHALLDTLNAGWLAQTTVADVRNLIAGTIPTVEHGPRHSLRWFAWRLVHKIRAQLSHYHRRGDPLPAHLRRWTRSHQQPSPSP